MAALAVAWTVERATHRRDKSHIENNNNNNLDVDKRAKRKLMGIKQIAAWAGSESG